MKKTRPKHATLTLILNKSNEICLNSMQLRECVSLSSCHSCSSQIDQSMQSVKVVIVMDLNSSNSLYFALSLSPSFSLSLSHLLSLLIFFLAFLFLLSEFEFFDFFFTVQYFPRFVFFREKRSDNLQSFWNFKRQSVIYTSAVSAKCMKKFAVDVLFRIELCSCCITSWF